MATGVSRGMPQYEPSILKPYDWKSNPFYGDLKKQSLNVKSPQMLGEFTSRWDPMYNYLMGGMKGINTGAGLGQYGSDLLNNMATQFQSNLLNPDSSQEYGLTMDRLTGQEGASRQALADRFAGWGRGSGVRDFQSAALDRDLSKQRADTSRETSIEAAENARRNALALEEMRGGFYESSKDRELTNAGLRKDLMLGGMSGAQGMMGSLADMLQWQGGQDLAADTTNQQFKNSLTQQMFGLYGEQEPGYQQALNQYENAQGQQNWTKQNFPGTYGNRVPAYKGITPPTNYKQRGYV